ncbi:hypothetical protein [Methylomagnum ishizawai]|uniref:hypothetical protein n=1 Tax=Methylomagnum ishizawai TaxID=1760988 RepID=UPI001C32B808|nr:hypothetical protein [Methylomagnum ishizawai]BBL73971.1 hypothetical protein MishRS11D_10690 [Methylomagnum ishizawai]
MDPWKAALTLYALAGLGALAHWAKRRLRGETPDGLFDHLGENFGHTLLSLFASLGAISSEIAALVANGTPVDGSPQSLALAFLTGYGADSALNKGSG